ncbi:MAG: hypothetical protein A3J93_02580 [Candidatus Magasanikbacteria bacterium RIFOXYC2_FULL_42_28]|uniref:Uncharacterized protein n=1 Tax=Candidatus Magasanikbacteria bacterium RIFOXYC2_FULL_42_28 TaxID=1798704 RepID=A0A1F6NWL7_9BACT|nr:MAG: hypothetical protein A3J93_02580 [Candidatus Magasanikbacteria bacterium RIFOXYC2_FULL_42_28]
MDKRPQPGVAQPSVEKEKNYPPLSGALKDWAGQVAGLFFVEGGNNTIVEWDAAGHLLDNWDQLPEDWQDELKKNIHFAEYNKKREDEENGIANYLWR